MGRDCAAIAATVAARRLGMRSVTLAKLRTDIDADGDGIASLGGTVDALRRLGVKCECVKVRDGRIPRFLSILHVKSSPLAEEADHLIACEPLASGRFAMYCFPYGVITQEAESIHEIWNGDAIVFRSREDNRAWLVLQIAASLMGVSLGAWIGTRAAESEGA